MATADVLIETGADLVRLFGHAPEAECRQFAGGAVALSGVPAADLNMIVLTAAAGREAFAGALAAARRRRLDAILVVEEGANALRGWAAEAGLSEVGRLPLMERPAGEIRDGHDVLVRPGTPGEVEEAMRLSSAAFALDEAACLAALPRTFLEADGNDLWVAEEDGALVGSGVFLRSGDRVGIYDMATPPAHQRRGIGRAILAGAIAHYQQQGVTRFTLGATEAGYPLYERCGFRVAARPHLYVIGASTQFPGQQASPAPIPPA